MPHPLPTADVIIELAGHELVLVRRRNPPHGWAFPGGFIDVGETAEEAAVREAREETGLRVELESLFNVYSDPARDPRQHTITVVFLCRAQGATLAGDDAAEARSFSAESIPGDLAFDHHQILADYLEYRHTGAMPRPRLVRRNAVSTEERSQLLAIARAAISKTPNDDAKSPPESGPGVLPEVGGAFVTLRLAGALRGCIGSLAPDRPLRQVVHDMAVAAAFEDPRFPPLDEREHEGLQIEISVLSPLRTSPVETIVAGWHGVCLSRLGRKAVFLPQVAREEGWSRQVLLEQTCLKAGLERDVWKAPDARIEAFTAEVFGDEPAPAESVT